MKLLDQFRLGKYTVSQPMLVAYPWLAQKGVLLNDLNAAVAFDVQNVYDWLDSDFMPKHIGEVMELKLCHLDEIRLPYPVIWLEYSTGLVGAPGGILAQQLDDDSCADILAPERRHGCPGTGPRRIRRIRRR